MWQRLDMAHEIWKIQKMSADPWYKVLRRLMLQRTGNSISLGLKKNRGLFFHNHFGDRGLFVSTQPLRNVVKDADHYTWSVEQNTVKLLPVLEEKSKHSAHSILVTGIPQQPAKGSWPLCSPLMLRQKDPNSSPRESEIRKYWKLRACLWATDACA